VEAGLADRDLPARQPDLRIAAFSQCGLESGGGLPPEGVSRRSSDDETQQVLVRVTYSATAALAWPGALAQVGLCRARAHRTASSTMCWATSANLRSSAWLIARSWANASSALRPVRPRMRPIA